VSVLSKDGWNRESSDEWGSEWSHDSKKTSIGLSKDGRVIAYFEENKITEKEKTAIETFLTQKGVAAYNQKDVGMYSDRQREAIVNYKTEGYKAINSDLRNGRQIDTEILDNAMAISRVGFTGYVFRGVNLSGEGAIRLNDPAYTSWSANGRVAADFASKESNAVLMLKVMPTTTGIRVDSVSRLMADDEQELLLPRGKSYKEVSRKIVGGRLMIEVENE